VVLLEATAEVVMEVAAGVVANSHITSHSSRTFNSWLGSASLHIITNY